MTKFGMTEGGVYAPLEMEVQMPTRRGILKSGAMASGAFAIGASPVGTVIRNMTGSIDNVVYAEDAAQEGIPEPRAMTSKEQQIADKFIRDWNNYRSQITVGSGESRSDRSPLQQVVVDSKWNKFLAMHAEFVFRSYTVDEYKQRDPHQFFIYKNTDTVKLATSESKRTDLGYLVYSGEFVNITWGPIGKLGESSFFRLLQDIRHGATFLYGVSEKEAADKDPENVGITYMEGTFKDGKRAYFGGVVINNLSNPIQRGYEPVIFPEGPENARGLKYGRRYGFDDARPPESIKDKIGSAGLPILAYFARIAGTWITKHEVKLYKGRQEVEGIEGVDGDILFFLPNTQLDKNSTYKAVISATIEEPGKEAYQNSWTREFKTGRSEFGPRR